jgi:diguanylate cyclase (GGDEF)-like protein/PAS domain S-box-containing protein
VNEFVKNLKLKLLFIFFVPAAGMLYFSSGYLYDKIIQYDNTGYLDSVSRYAKISDNLICQLQKERGLSIAYITRSSKYYKEKLEKQRELTDKSYLELDEYIDKYGIAQRERDLKKVIELYSGIDSIRKRVDDRSMDIFGILEYYSTMVGSLIESSDILRSKFINEEFLRTIVSFRRLMILGEMSGRERALVSHILEHGEYSEKVRNLLIRWEMEFKQTMEDFESDATLTVFAKYRNSIDSNFESRFFDMKSAIIFEKKLDITNSREWWKVSTHYIDSIHRTNETVLGILMKMKESLKRDALEALAVSAFIWILSISALFFLIRIINRIMDTFGELVSQIDEQKRLYKVFSEFFELLIYNDDMQTILTSMCVILNQTDRFKNIWIAELDGEKIEPIVTENISSALIKQELENDSDRRARLFDDLRRVAKDGRGSVSYPKNYKNPLCRGVSMFSIFPIIQNGKSKYLLVVSVKKDYEMDLHMSDMVTRMCGALTYAFEKIEIKDREKKLEEELRIAASTLDAHEAITITDLQGRIIKVNKAFSDITGYSEEEVIGKNPSILKSGRHNKNFYVQMWDAIRKHGYWKGEIYNRRKSGEIYPEMLSVSAIENEDGEVTHYVAHFFDISDMKEAQENAEYRALHDPLTDLYNRQKMMEDIERIYEEYKHSGDYGAFFFLDLDNFKHINDHYGHDVGDRVLEEIARRLKEAVYQSDLVYRVAGDEFAIIATRLGNDRNIAIAKATIFIERIMDIFDEKIVIEGNSMDLSFSIGVKIFPDGEESDREVMVDADIAMYYAKKGGKNAYHFFDEGLNERSKEYLRTKNELSEAIGDEEQLLIFYQPKVSIADGKVVGFEALLRWKRSDGEILAPSEFIYATVGNRLGYRLNEYVLATVCSHISRWNEQLGGIDMRISINISTEQFVDGRFEDTVTRIVEESGTDPKNIDFEILEDALLHDIDGAIDTINRLKEKGYSFSIDDFGTGYSSLNYLSKLPANTLKLDKSFIFNISDSKSEAIVRMIIETAHIFGMSTVAEGVESEEELHKLETLGCDIYQGYLFSKPVPFAKVKELISG